MSGPLAYKHLQRAISQWPKDGLRPDCQLQDALAQRLEKQSVEQIDLKQVNAMYSLLENRYMTKYPIRGKLMEPTSNPTYYTDLIQEVAEAPTRTWLQRMAKRLGSTIRIDSKKVFGSGNFGYIRRDISPTDLYDIGTAF